MNDEERAQFKPKFTGLVIIIDIMLLAAAAAIALGVIAPASWGPKIPVIIICAVIAVALLVVFIIKYRATKAWLAVHGTTRAERLAELNAEKEAERAKIRAELEAELREEIEAEKRKEAERAQIRAEVEAELREEMEAEKKKGGI